MGGKPMYESRRRAVLEGLLMQAIKEAGGIPACRVSTARLGSVRWKYWGLVRCVVAISRRRPKRPVVRPLEAAAREYRSPRKARREALIRFPNRILLPNGGLREESALAEVLSRVRERYQLSPDLSAAISAEIDKS